MSLTTRARKSFKHGFTIHAGPPPQCESSIIFAPLFVPEPHFSDSTFSENALNRNRSMLEKTLNSLIGMLLLYLRIRRSLSKAIAVVAI
jgi:hypothetical protein